MDKYEGMNKVETSVTRVDTKLKKNRFANMSRRGLFVKIMVGGVLLGLIFSLQLLPFQFAETTRNAIRTAITFDMMGSDRESQGEIGFVEGIRNLRDREEEKEESDNYDA
ncbi:MAG: hypothetical protein FWC11_04715 [Firmicutes bacterium]|nr:hypothetical protein [Bacillota bacterium]MCL2256144.1 hypothetical protein [Bacillota bacterium]